MFDDDQPAREVSIRELSRQAPAVVREVANGGRVVVTRHGRPVAVILEVEAGIEAMLAGSREFARLRRELLEEVDAGVAVALGPPPPLPL